MACGTLLFAWFTTSAGALITFEFWQIYPLKLIAGWNRVLILMKSKASPVHHHYCYYSVYCGWGVSRATVACSGANQMRWWWWWCDCIMCDVADVHSLRFIYKFWMTAIRVACRIRALYAVVTLMSIPSFHTLHHPQSTSKSTHSHTSPLNVRQYMRGTLPFILCTVDNVSTYYNYYYYHHPVPRRILYFIQWLAWPRPLNLSSSHIANCHLMTILPFIVDCVSLRHALIWNITLQMCWWHISEKFNGWNYWVVTFDWL